MQCMPELHLHEKVAAKGMKVQPTVLPVLTPWTFYSGIAKRVCSGSGCWEQQNLLAITLQSVQSVSTGGAVNWTPIPILGVTNLLLGANAAQGSLE